MTRACLCCATIATAAFTSSVLNLPSRASQKVSGSVLPADPMPASPDLTLTNQMMNPLMMRRLASQRTHLRSCANARWAYLVLILLLAVHQLIYPHTGGCWCYTWASWVMPNSHTSSPVGWLSTREVRPGALWLHLSGASHGTMSSRFLPFDIARKSCLVRKTASCSS